jgi:hypothetical protein
MPVNSRFRSSERLKAGGDSDDEKLWPTQKWFTRQIPERWRRVVRLAVDRREFFLRQEALAWFAVVRKVFHPLGTVQDHVAPLFGLAEQMADARDLLLLRDRFHAVLAVLPILLNPA